MSRLTPDELEEMRRLATMGYAPYWGGIDDEQDPDPVIPLKRSQVAEYQRLLLRALEEIERLYEKQSAALEVTDLVLDALSARDVDAFVDCYAENARIETGLGQTLASGRDDIRRRYTAMFAEFPTIVVRKINSFTVGSWVIQEEEAIGRGSESARHVAVYRVESGLIAHERLLK